VFLLSPRKFFLFVHKHFPIEANLLVLSLVLPQVSPSLHPNPPPPIYNHSTSLNMVGSKSTPHHTTPRILASETLPLNPQTSYLVGKGVPILLSQPLIMRRDFVIHRFFWPFFFSSLCNIPPCQPPQGVPPVLKVLFLPTDDCFPRPPE